MAKYIELDLVLKEVEPDYRPQLARRISEIPAADVAPVVRGRWIDVEDSPLSTCSVCGFSLGSYTFNYCPNCGAKMEVQDG